MLTDALQIAIDALRIEDVYLSRISATIENGFNPKQNQDELDQLIIQTRHIVTQTEVLEGEDTSPSLLRVTVRVGVRFARPAENSEPTDSDARATIEADFIAEYAMTELLDQQAIDEFAKKNVSYHVWPYWRELLASQCMRMRLPQIMLPTVQLAQNRES